MKGSSASRGPWTVTVSSKGQLSVPAALCRRFGLRKGSKLGLVTNGADEFIVAVSPLAEAIGLKKGASKL